MSASQEIPPPPPKQRVSPLDVRNTDLVSRLLAATPPYLYNMPLVPNSYFFSEMLRSLVQAKSETSAKVGTATSLQNRRFRKRSWTQARNDNLSKILSIPERQESQLNWTLKCPLPEKNDIVNKSSSENNLQLTVSKVSLDNTKNFQEKKTDLGITDLSINSFIDTNPKQESSNANISMMYPKISADLNRESNLILPSSPMWYPSLYPPPYGMDPLHFFIDLHVSDHVFERKKRKEVASDVLFPKGSSLQDKSIETSDSQENIHTFQNLYSIGSGLKQARQSSAFRVPVHNTLRNTQICLSNEIMYNAGETKQKVSKFDVKSMGFDKSYNKTSTRYIMNNIENIYKTIQNQCIPKTDADNIQENDLADRKAYTKSKQKEELNETKEEKEKRVKGLQALIGLELVVDYMNHSKPEDSENVEKTFTDTESTDNSLIEVISVEDNNMGIIT